MTTSELQDAFLAELALGCTATARRITRRLKETTERSDETDAEIVFDELQGLMHGILVTFDAGSGLADKGLISIVDEQGNTFDRHSNELCFEHWRKLNPDA